MAWAHVQTNGTQPGGSATTVAVAYAGAVAAGNMLCCFIAALTGLTISGVEDSVNGVWSLAKFVDGGANPGIGAIYYFPNTGEGTPTVTVTFSGSAGGRRLIVSEYSGLDLTAPFDVGAGQGQTNTGTGTDAVTSGAVAATAAANELVYGGTNVTTTTVTAGTDFTARFNNGVSGKVTTVEDKDSGAAGTTPAATFTVDNAGADPVSVVATFKAAAAGGGGNSWYQYQQQALAAGG